MEQQEREKLAFDYARDTTKQLMTLATAVVALTATFSKDFIGGAPKELYPYVVSSWVLLLISLVCGQWCLMALTGVLGNTKRPSRLGVYERGVTLPAILQVLAFIGGLSLFVLFAAKALPS